MSDQTCDCGEIPVERTTGDTAGEVRWIGERPATAAPLPADVTGEMSRFLGGEPIDTLDDFLVAVRTTTGGGSIAVEDLCHVAAGTPHQATTSEETYSFRCFYDGIVLAGLADEPVEIRTQSPMGERIEVRVALDGIVDTDPPDAAMSFGIATDARVPAAGGSTKRAALYRDVCPYVRAFPSREAYERWAEHVDAATVGLSIAAGVPIAAALTE